MKLKTLKDIEEEMTGIEDGPYVFYKEIKQEAIKWVKEWKNEKKHHYCPRVLTCQSCLKTSGKIEGVMEFHNITEVDLSQGMTQEVPQ